MPFDPRRPVRVCTPADDADARRREPMVLLAVMRLQAAKESAAALRLAHQVLGWGPDEIAAARRFCPMRQVGG